MKNKKDILLLLQFFYPEYISSATLPFDTASKLVKEGFTVDVLCGYPHEYTNDDRVPRKETVNGIHIKRVKYWHLDKKKALGRIVNFLSLTVSMAFRLFSMRKYKTIVVYSNPPVLPLVAAMASKLFKCKLVFVAYDLYPEVALRTNSLSEGGMVTKLMNFVNKSVYQRANAVVALSSEMKDFIVQNRKIDADKVHVISNWYEDAYQPEQKKADNRFASLVNDRLVVGYFGNMGVAQDMEPVKEAIKHYKDDPEVCFLLSGHGSKHADIEKMIADENIENAYLYGFLQGQDYLDALSISDCAIVSLEKGLTGLSVPSKTYGYMMQGIPVVAIMDESDIVNDVKQGAGYHIPENSSDKLIELIGKLKKNPTDCKEKGIKCREIYCEKYTPQICLERYVTLLNKLK